MSQDYYPIYCILWQCTANILTIHQSIPVNGVATLTLGVEVLESTGNVSRMVEDMEEKHGVHYVKILARSDNYDSCCSYGLRHNRSRCGRDLWKKTRNHR